jgi:hypothetical protein
MHLHLLENTEISKMRDYFVGATATTLDRKLSNSFDPSSRRREADCCANAAFSFNASVGL